MKVLIVGGAGYIGSHMVKMLSNNDHHVVTFDNLSNGFREAVHYGDFIFGDLADKNQLSHVFEKHQFDAVMHFASFIEVGESVIYPDKYYQNNLLNTIQLLNTMVLYGVKNFIFSSSAAVFGNPVYTPIDEIHSKQPINPYGKSKLMVEQVLEDYDRAYGLKSIKLRYFNAAGADPAGELGECHDPETHLIPLILQAASGRRENIKVFGRNYETPDGTCIRDYIHVTDICAAHLLALDSLLVTDESDAYNLGNGNGFSVQKVVDVAKEVTGVNFVVVDESRREGDPAVLVADASRAKDKLGWQPGYESLETIIQHAWNWEKQKNQYLVV